MRRFALIVVLGILATPAGAQQPPPADAQQLAAKLPGVLNAWEKAMSSLSSFHLEINRSTVDFALKSNEVFEGRAIFSKGKGPNEPNRARMELVKKNNPEVYEKLICTGTFVYKYEPAAKTISIYDMPAPKPGQGNEDNFLTFLFGMKATEAMQRYDIQLAGSDKHYHYLRVIPKLPQDKAEFSEARLTLLAATHLPRQVWYRHPNNNEITWDFPKVAVDVPIPATYFAPPQETPAGWQVRRVPRQEASAPQQPPPSVVRPKQP